MISYHGTIKEKTLKIVKEGFSPECQGENGSHFGFERQHYSNRRSQRRRKKRRRKRKAKEIAKNLLQEGFSIEKVRKLTGLDEE
jgi:hypothetical protein